MAPGYSPRRSAPQTRSQSPSAEARAHYALSHNGIMAANSRSGAGSPSHEMSGSGRPYPKRTREIQQEGKSTAPLNMWSGPPTSGNSTPLRENIPESPTDGFPDFAQLPTPESLPPTRRARAGTVPSRFSPGGPLSVQSLAPKSARATPSAPTPFNKSQSPSPSLDPPEGSSSSGSALLSRLRAGSMPQRSPFAPAPATAAPAGSPFGPSIFSTGWNPAGVGRERGSTLASIASVGSNGPSSPAQSQFSSKEAVGESDGPARHALHGQL
ncbi:hypothetical protein CDD80_2376 [Ophiocordyceps camponoti-rufipedis]|uniref:Uncharacterized protein n=1 Tax=Ophiocordyceps camponoti-rufipedis TaxID=2004952 RepID=A0A2C5X6T2_9HYPO|nr:hypothetical protein CDD80_2376 [Ophiocordyceps camponoti-rufipedis]